MVDKTLRYLGLAKRAGSVVTGTQSCAAAMEKSGIRLLLIAEDIADNSREKVTRTAEKTGTHYEIWGMSEELSRMTGTAGRYVFGITDEHFAGAILQEIHKRVK
ncbi:MAG: ribosomal L7Ae/L30e/S12e/Gadd45 family protein [Firmicutes bacterium]|nr:ribosomal L7Ae/L30e/S12e/Gadd45 family protein [Bacillota bacterium]